MKSCALLVCLPDLTTQSGSCPDITVIQWLSTRRPDRHVNTDSEGGLAGAAQPGGAGAAGGGLGRQAGFLPVQPARPASLQLQLELHEHTTCESEKSGIKFYG